MVKVGDVFTLGWSYYDYRHFIVVAISEFNLYEKLHAYWERTRNQTTLDFPIDLEDGFAEFVKELVADGLVKEIPLAIEVIPPTSSGSTYVSEIFTAGVCAEESIDEWKQMTDH